MTKMWVYYYFLGRKYGHSPVVSATWASKFCGWWGAKADGWNVGCAPSLPVKEG